MNTRRKARRSRKDIIGAHISAVPRFFVGMAVLPPFLLLEDLALKAVLVTFFAILALLAGKRIRWTYFLVLSLSICFFHLLAPWGRVLFRVGPLPVTLGALKNGAFRSLTLIGMVFLSVAAVRPELELPGRLGGLLGRTFYHFEAIIDGKSRLSGKAFLSGLDALLLEKFDPRQADFGLGREIDGPGEEYPQENSPDGNGESDASPGDVPPPTGKKEATGQFGWLPALLFTLIPWAFWAWPLVGRPWN